MVSAGRVLCKLALLIAIPSCSSVAHSTPPQATPGTPDPALDPVGAKLQLFYRLLEPNGGELADISQFLHDNQRWPLRGQLMQRRDEALAREPDDSAAASSCDATPPVTSGGWQRCATAHAKTNAIVHVPDDVHHAWILLGHDAGTEASFRRQWGTYLLPDAAYDRFSATIGDVAAANRQISLMSPPERKLAQARLALRANQPDALAKVGALDADRQDDPALLLEEAAWLRRAERFNEAATLWQKPALAALGTGAAWNERDRLCRQLLLTDPVSAYAVAGTFQGSGEPQLDAEFLAGWIALRRLNDPARAKPHFETLAHASKSAITQGRAHYWLARTDEAAGTPQLAGEEYSNAAVWGTTYYGQLAGQALKKRFDLGRDPFWTKQQAVAFVQNELARSALYLAAWGQPGRASPFLKLLGQSTEPADRALAAQLALKLHMPDQAVAIARLAGRDGIMLPESGWPMPVTPPNPDPALALGVMRQESSFDPRIVSSSGAVGMMQLLPGTARDVARANALPGAPLTDPDVNMRLGNLYLHELLADFGGSVPLAVASYNAGPHRVRSWLEKDDVLNGTDMVDWVEMIPYGETRNYVQRVQENKIVYETKIGQKTHD